jgi:hypothetical protein
MGNYLIVLDPLVGLEVVLAHRGFGLGVVDNAVGIAEVSLAFDFAILDLGIFFLLFRCHGLDFGGLGLVGDDRLLFLVFRDGHLRQLANRGGLRLVGSGLRLVFSGLRLLVGLRLLLDFGGGELLDEHLELARVLATPNTKGLLLGVVLAEVGLANLLELAAVAVEVVFVVAHHLELAALEVVLLVEGASTAAAVVVGDGTGLAGGVANAFDFFLGLGVGLLGARVLDLDGLELDRLDVDASHDLFHHLVDSHILVLASEVDGRLDGRGEDSLEVENGAGRHVWFACGFECSKGVCLGYILRLVNFLLV